MANFSAYDDIDPLLAEYLANDKEIINERLQYLSRMFPDADNNYLKAIVTDSQGIESELSDLVETRLLFTNYPKKYEQNMKSLIEKNRGGFDLDDFLLQYPEPLAFFENEYRIGTYSVEVVKYFCKRYTTSALEIENYYKKSNYNVSLTDRSIRKDFLMKGKPAIIETKNLLILQEIAFIENKSFIESQLKERNSNNESLHVEAKLLECECCNNFGISITNIIMCDSNHSVCKKCFIQAGLMAIAMKKTSLNCFMGCNYEFPVELLKKVLPSFMCQTLNNNKTESDIVKAKVTNLVNCPFCTISIEVDAEIRLIQCQNPVCMQITCRDCNRENHLPLTCEEKREHHSMRLFNEELQTKDVVRTCPACKKTFIKDGGCNLITCSCGCKICYLCNQLIDGYEHFASSACIQ